MGRMASKVRIRGRSGSRSHKRTSTSYLSRDALLTLGGITEDQLRLWEFEEIVSYSTVLEVDGRRMPVYDHLTLRRIRTIRSLVEDLGINLPGIAVILHLLDQLSSR